MEESFLCIASIEVECYTYQSYSSKKSAMWLNLIVPLITWSCCYSCRSIKVWELHAIALPVTSFLDLVY